MDRLASRNRKLRVHIFSHVHGPSSKARSQTLKGRLQGHISPSRATLPQPSKGHHSLGSGAQINEPMGDFSYLNHPKEPGNCGAPDLSKREIRTGDL